MDPPSYEATVPVSTLPHRSIQDLRAQILANGSLMTRTIERNIGHPTDYLEVIVAKISASATLTQQRAPRNAYGDEKHANSEKSASRSAPPPTVAGSSSSASAAHVGKHYAVLVRRATSTKTARIIVKGEPKDNVEEALEWILERTERVMHDVVVRYGKPDEGECTAM